ncbi:CHC2 zinc finger domain-containing protein [Sphaerotilaceae bacterium SBD11-9]
MPDAVSFYEAGGVSLRGRGPWRTAPCPFHGGSDSLRVNIETGGFKCMSCGQHGGDVLAFQMRLHGLDFVSAARALGAYRDDGGPHRGRTKATPLPARDLLNMARSEALVVFVIAAAIYDARAITERDYTRLREAVSKLETICAPQG